MFQLDGTIHLGLAAFCLDGMEITDLLVKESVYYYGKWCMTNDRLGGE